MGCTGGIAENGHLKHWSQMRHDNEPTAVVNNLNNQVFGFLNIDTKILAGIPTFARSRFMAFTL